MISRISTFLTCTWLLLAFATARADVFDQYTSRDLATALESDGAREMKELTAKSLSDHGGVLRGTTGTMIIVRTNENRLAKLIVQPARQKVADVMTSILLIERFVTFRDGTERAVHATGQNVQLYPGLHFNLDLGQVVPATIGGDLTLPVDAARQASQPMTVANKARMYLVTKAPPPSAPLKGGKVVVGETFETRYFNGTYKLHDDGRRSGTLTLKVTDAGEVTGSFYSDKDGEKYDVWGKVGNPRHAIQFTIKFPRVEETFQGHLFTGDARAIAGTAKMQDREAGFYAVRIEE